MVKWWIMIYKDIKMIQILQLTDKFRNIDVYKRLDMLEQWCWVVLCPDDVKIIFFLCVLIGSRDDGAYFLSDKQSKVDWRQKSEIKPLCAGNHLRRCKSDNNWNSECFDFYHFSFQKTNATQTESSGFGWLNHNYWLPSIRRLAQSNRLPIVIKFNKERGALRRWSQVEN